MHEHIYLLTVEVYFRPCECGVHTESRVIAASTDGVISGSTATSRRSHIYIVLCHSIMQTRPARGKSRYVWLCFGCGTCSVSSNNIAPNEEGAFLLLAGSAVQICINASEFDHHRIARI